MATDYATIVVRRGNADAWENSQRPLASGEWGYDETGRVIKIGDGYTLWPDLAAAITAGVSGQLPDAVREALAANIADQSTPEGAAVAAAVPLDSSAVQLENVDSPGWAWVVLYEATREVAFGQYTDGSYYPGQTDDAVASVVLSDDQGWLFAVYYAGSNEIQYGVRADGSIYPPPAAAGNAARTVLVGDSLTQNWNSYLASLSTAIKRPIDDIGIGGQGSTSIAARYGGAPARVAANVLIPASGSVGITLNVGPFSDTTTQFPVSISGVQGTFVSSTASDNFRSGTFTRSAPGTATRVWAGTPVLSRLDYRDAWPVLGMGRNGFSVDGALPQIIADIRGCIDWARPVAREHALVWSIPPFAGEENGTPARATLDAANTAIRDAFPTRWVDLSGYLRSAEALQSVGITPTSQDLTDISNGMTPTSFRTQANGGVDAGHFGPTAYAALNLRLAAEYASRDWIS